MNAYAIIAGFLGTAVEFIEALTVVMAVGATKGWKSSIGGAMASTALLVLLTAVFGASLSNLINLSYVQLIVGAFMLFFGARWLRKAILRYAGLKAIHDETEAYERELKRQREQQGKTGAIDWFGFGASFNIVLLEGIEAIFIVLTFGASSHALPSAVVGGLIGLFAVIGAGVALRKPLAMISENAMKFVVGIMLTAFGVFWVGEGLGVEWWRGDVSILVLAAFLLAASVFFARALSAFKKEAKAK